MLGEFLIRVLRDLQDKRVNWHNTPFETRLERALNGGGAAAVRVVDEGGCGNNGCSEGMVVPDETHLDYLPPPPVLMGQSPPHSPRATHSPLMFTPQVHF